MFSIEVLKHETLITSIQNSIDFILKNHPSTLRKVILFGSCARGDATSASDIDLCLVFDDSAEITSRQMLQYKGYLRCIDDYERDLVFCRQTQLSNQECLLYQFINRDGKVLLDLTN